MCVNIGVCTAVSAWYIDAVPSYWVLMKKYSIVHENVLKSENIRIMSTMYFPLKKLSPLRCLDPV